MALNNYANLKTAIANFLARDDLTSEIDDFIEGLTMKRYLYEPSVDENTGEHLNSGEYK